MKQLSFVRKGADKKRLRFSLKISGSSVRHSVFLSRSQWGCAIERASQSRNRYLDFHNVVSKHHEAINSFLEGGGAVSIGREEKLASRNVSSVERMRRP